MTDTLDALAEHTRAASELRASELRHLHSDDNSASAMAERVVLRQGEQIALRRYVEARKVYENFRQASIGVKPIGAQERPSCLLWPDSSSA